MKFMKFAPIAFTACTLLGASAYAQGDLSSGQSVTIPVGQLKFHGFGALGVNPKTQITEADAYGDFMKGKHASFFMFSPGYVSPLHSHTHDYYAAVLKGVMQNYEVGVKPVNLRPGSYWYQVGKKAHTTTCISKTPCEIFIVQSTKFDAQIPPKED